MAMRDRENSAKSDKSSELIEFLPAGKKVSVNQKKSLLQLAVEQKLKINHSCGGSGSCGTCLVKILHGLEKLPERSDVEKEMAEDRGFSPEERLACQTPAQCALVVDLCFFEESDEMKKGFV